MMSPGIILGAMSLGELVDALNRLPAGSKVWLGSGRFRPQGLRSYRGYYEDLALGWCIGEPRDARALANELHEAIGCDFEGYKGGTYTAGRDTGVWASERPGDCYGNAVTGIVPAGLRHPNVWEIVVERIDD